MGRSRSAKRAVAEQAWRPLVRFFFDTVRRRERILRRLGLTPGDAKALMALDRHEGRTMRALAEAWTCDASNATWIVDRLEERGLAERRSVPTDRRVKLVVLTEAGARTKAGLIEEMYRPPPELLQMDLADLEALRDVAARLPAAAPEEAPMSEGAGRRRGASRPDAARSPAEARP